MTDICHKCEIINGNPLMCGGKIEEIVTRENGNFVVDRVCSVCGKSQSLEPIVLSNISEEMVQIVFPGFFPEQLKLI